MKDVLIALEALTGCAPDRRDLAAEALGDFLRGAALDAATARLVVGRLVGLAVTEPVTEVRESALNAVSEAFDHYSLPLDLVEPLASVVRTLEPELLEYALYIFGATRDPRARPLIEPFLHHFCPNVREEARLAAAELAVSATFDDRSPGFTPE
ncbi:hypothetical protein [Nocardiopsis ganjiahuensis]|uniref:hypothetical protein n=1 Tax=Nocardiopsis ganjiahuensis TaxID=239984 RepID=UPI000346A9AC|nr:hypothetical protein [Nocardiopsis ganjiahuensis]